MQKNVFCGALTEPGGLENAALMCVDGFRET